MSRREAERKTERKRETERYSRKRRVLFEKKKHLMAEGERDINAKEENQGMFIFKKQER